MSEQKQQKREYHLVPVKVITIFYQRPENNLLNLSRNKITQ